MSLKMTQNLNNEIFDEYGTDPIALCKDWLSEAVAKEINDPEAVCLATSTPDGRPSNRMVLIKEIDERGFKFHTNAESRKGEEIQENPHAALCFHWKSLRKQIRIEGQVHAISEEESDKYFTTRPIERQIGAWASDQSRPYETLAEMQAAIEKYTQKFKDVENIPRPPHWKGFRLDPTSIEFWIGNRARLHTRFVYTKTDDGTWNATWLCP